MRSLSWCILKIEVNFRHGNIQPYTLGKDLFPFSVSPSVYHSLLKPLALSVCQPAVAMDISLGEREPWEFWLFRVMYNVAGGFDKYADSDRKIQNHLF